MAVDGYGLRLIGFIRPLDLGDATIVGNDSRNNVEGNDEFGIRNASEHPVGASCDYWGHPTGPVHPGNPFENPEGNEIDGDVEFSPWSVRPIRDGEATRIGRRQIGDSRNQPPDPNGYGRHR